MKTLPIAAAFGFFGAIAVTVSFSQQWPTWVMFIAWVSFYIFGKKWQSSLWAFLQIILGMGMAVLIQLTAGFLEQFIGGFGFPVSVFFYIGSLAYFAGTQKLNNIPAWFLGLIILFGVHPPLEPLPILKLLIPITAGFIFAWLNNKTVEIIHEKQVTGSSAQ
ncbi:DUF1097 domain-containing protein [Chryseobacterium sp.]|jgi:hypothetical protein|uniref:DUF1097 domain-containing protein n=1 Tax=Chryseobacterium sp. TaxID=1871047 RepID=UPI0028428349|nr:DUF1097 domain-containing protein [Chryseobacterium sp.]MDR3023046.1 DUF1097 domain-containing protein [Chryseobacterium sp.]